MRLFNNIVMRYSGLVGTGGSGGGSLRPGIPESIEAILINGGKVEPKVAVLKRFRARLPSGRAARLEPMGPLS
jgi:hypothetical protein